MRCREDGLSPDDYEGVPYPHPYLSLWIDCKRYSTSPTGTPLLPEPERGVADQDADVWLAFEVLEDAQEMKAEQDRLRRKVQDVARAANFQL